MKIKETNQIYSPLKISQSINAESLCDRNTLREEILGGRKFGGFRGFDKNPLN